MKFTVALINGILWVVTFICDLLTLPFFFIYQQPWKKTRAFYEPKAQAISDEGGITFRGTSPISEMHRELKRKKIDTMDKVFQYAVKRNGSKQCLGSREVIAEEDEMQPDGKMFKKYVLGEYLWKSYNEVDRLAVAFSKGLLELGLEPKGKLAIFAETRAEWLISAMGAFRQSVSIVTLYATLGEDAIVLGLKETEAEYLLTSHDQLPKLKSVLKQTPKVKTIIYMEDSLNETDTSGYPSDVEILAFCDVISLGNRSLKGTCVPHADDVAIIMYTSGSTGVPKGVLLSHRNVSTAMMALSDVLCPTYPEDIYLGYLPLAHVFELMVEAVCFFCGVPIGYSSALTMIDSSSKVKLGCKGDATILKPTILATVPLVMDRIYKGIQEKISLSSSVAQTVFEFFYQYKKKWFYRGYQCPLADKFIFDSVRKVVGGKVRLLACGGAPLAPEVHEFLRTTLCHPLVQGYGLTETAACAAVTLRSDMSTGRVGPPSACCAIRLVDWKEGNYSVVDKPYPRGEILVGGDNVALGYYNISNESNQDFIEENGNRWFRTGDIGEMQADGVLKVIDRKKDLVKLQFGEYISLGKIEAELRSSYVVENICVYADPSKTFCVALVVPNPKYIQALADKIQISDHTYEMLCKDLEIEEAVLHEITIHAATRKLQKFEIPGAVKLCAEVWLPDTGLVTAAFKLKRKNIQYKYQDYIDKMYAP